MRHSLVAGKMKSENEGMKVKESLQKFLEIFSHKTHANGAVVEISLLHPKLFSGAAGAVHAAADQA